MYILVDAGAILLLVAIAFVCAMWLLSKFRALRLFSSANEDDLNRMITSSRTHPIVSMKDLWIYLSPSRITDAQREALTAQVRALIPQLIAAAGDEAALVHAVVSSGNYHFPYLEDAGNYATQLIFYAYNEKGKKGLLQDTYAVQTILILNGWRNADWFVLSIQTGQMRKQYYRGNNLVSTARFYPEEDVEVGYVIASNWWRYMGDDRSVQYWCAESGKWGKFDAATRYTKKEAGRMDITCIGGTRPIWRLIAVPSTPYTGNEND